MGLGLYGASCRTGPAYIWLKGDIFSSIWQEDGKDHVCQECCVKHPCEQYLYGKGNPFPEPYDALGKQAQPEQPEGAKAEDGKQADVAADGTDGACIIPVARLKYMEQQPACHVFNQAAAGGAE